MDVMDIQLVSLSQVPFDIQRFSQFDFASCHSMWTEGFLQVRLLVQVSCEQERAWGQDFWTVRLPSPGSHPGAETEKGRGLGRAGGLTDLSTTID